jgi:SNF2 family DNA or RNA helicase
MAAKEGFSLYSVRQVHLIDPSWNISRQQQIIGRAIRFCSHKLLPEEDRNVKVYVYLATSENEEETVDQYIAKLAMRKDKLISEFETAIKEAAIDCTLFKNGNELAGDVGITCDP